jgi:hypothetical protein
MTLEEEIQAVDEVVAFGRGVATEHAERAAGALRLEATVLAHYKDFLDGTIINARSTLTHCRELAAAPADGSAGVARGLLAVARESIRLMYVAMDVLEQRAGSARQGTTASAALRACSFCGKTEAETKLVAGPVANICVSCVRLACGVLGIKILPERG